MSMLNPKLDRKALAASYASDDRVRVANILQQDIAERIMDICSGDVPWGYLTFIDNRNVVISTADLERMGQEESYELHRKIGKQPRRASGFSTVVTRSIARSRIPIAKT